MFLSFRKSVSYLTVGFVLFCWSNPSLLAQDEMKVGDTIEVEFVGRMITTQITGFTDVGWVKFKVNFAGNVQEINKPKNQVVWLKKRVAEFRDWQSSGGGFSVNAKLMKHVGANVTLVDKNGKELKVQQSKLSPLDRTYLKVFKTPIRVRGGSRTSGGFGGPGSNGFGGSGRGSGRGGMGQGGTGNGGVQLPPGIEVPPGVDIPGLSNNSKGDNENAADGFGGGFRNAGQPGFRNKRKEVSKDPSGGFAMTPLDSSNVTSFKEAKSFKPSEPNWLPRGVSSGAIMFEFDSGGSPLHETFSQVVLSRDGRYAAIGGSNSLQNTSRLFVFDLQSKKVLAEKEFSAREVVPLAFSPDSKTLAVNHSFGMTGQTSLFLWEFGNGLVFKKGWTVGQSISKKGLFVSDTRLVTLNFMGASLIDIEKDKVLARIEADEATSPAGGTIYGVEGSHTTSAIDFAKGTFFKVSSNSRDRLGFLPALSASGRFVAHERAGNIAILDLTNGQETSEFSASRPQFLGDQYVFAGGYLFDVKRGAPVVDFELARNTQSFAFTTDGTALYVARSDAVKEEHMAWLVVADLLTPALKQEIASFTVGNPITIKSGSQISLNLSGVSKQVVKKMKNSLTKNGLTIVENSDLKLVSENRVLPSESRDVGLMLRGERTVAPITFTPTVSEIYLTYKGKRLWGKTKTNRPGSYMRGEQGESPQTTATRLSRPDPKFFENANYPTRIVLYPGTMPKIRLTEKGVE